MGHWHGVCRLGLVDNRCKKHDWVHLRNRQSADRTHDSPSKRPFQQSRAGRRSFPSNAFFEAFPFRPDFVTTSVSIGEISRHASSFQRRSSSAKRQPIWIANQGGHAARQSMLSHDHCRRRPLYPFRCVCRSFAIDRQIPTSSRTARVHSKWPLVKACLSLSVGESRSLSLCIIDWAE